MLSAPTETPPADGLPHTLGAGQQVFGRYQLQKILGQGGMGVVWLARDTQLDRPVALKFVADPYFRDAATRDDLRRETRRTLELTHPNIIRTFDYLEDANSAAISLEYVDGLTLSQLRVQRPSGTFDTEDLGDIVRDCCEALDYAHHDACVVHRDLKPSNIMVTSRGVAKIADFGISCGLQSTAARISAFNTSGGTLGYMSPQQLRGELASPSDDIYAFGAMLYELLTGRPPFHTGDLSYQIREIVVEPVDERRAKMNVEGRPIPKEWVETIAACLAKDPAQRPATMREVAQRLGVGDRASARHRPDPDRTTMIKRPESGIQSAPVAVPVPAPAPKPEPTPAAKKANLLQIAWIVAAVVVAIVGVVVGVVAVLLPAKRQQEEAEQKATKVAVAEAAAEAAATGGMVVKSNPSGASVYVGKDLKGTTPCSITGLKAGTHEVLLSLAGYEPKTSMVALRAGEAADLGTVALSRLTGTLLMESDPQGSTFVVLSANGQDEIRRGRTPDKVGGLPTGKYRVRLERLGWPVYESEVEVNGEAMRVVSRKFGHGTLEVASEPPGAELRLNGKTLGPTPRLESLMSGKHGPFTLHRKGYKPAQFEAEIRADEVTRVPVVTLEPEPPSLTVTTEPPGVKFRLYANGTEPGVGLPIVEGTSPGHLLDVPAGMYRVEFELPPWPPVSRAVLVAAGGVTELQQTFEGGKISVTSNPVGAAVLLGGKEVGKTPFEMELPTGPYEVSASYKGRVARTRNVEIAKDDAETIKFDFTTGSSTSSKSKSRRKPAPKETVFKKVGRSISNFFNMDPKRKR